MHATRLTGRERPLCALVREPRSRLSSPSRYGRFRGTGFPKCQSSVSAASGLRSDARNPRSLLVQFCRVHGASRGVSRRASTIRRVTAEALPGGSKSSRSNHPGTFLNARRTCLLQLSPTPFRDVTYRSTRSFQYHRASVGTVSSERPEGERRDKTSFCPRASVKVDPRSPTQCQVGPL